MPRYRKSESSRIKEEARQKLLEAALAEFAAQGYADANINRISQAAGYAQGTIYNYFPSKQALFEAVVGDIARQHSELILQGAAGAANPAARLERFFAAGFAFAQGLPAAAQVISAALHGADPEVRALVRRAYEPLVTFVREEIVQAGQIEGLFRRVDAETATALVLAVYLSGCSALAEGQHIRRNPRVVAGLVLEGLRAK